jgi:hypothetical protein
VSSSRDSSSCISSSWPWLERAICIFIFFAKFFAFKKFGLQNSPKIKIVSSKRVLFKLSVLNWKKLLFKLTAKLISKFNLM